jgi:hypothetical protein
MSAPPILALLITNRTPAAINAFHVSLTDPGNVFARDGRFCVHPTENRNALHLMHLLVVA